MCKGCEYYISYGRLFNTGFCIKYLENKDGDDSCFDEQEKNDSTSDKIYNTFMGGSYE